MSMVLVLTHGFQQMRKSDDAWEDMDEVPALVLTGVVGPNAPHTGPLRVRFENVQASLEAQKRTCWLASSNDPAVLYVEVMSSGRGHPKNGFVTFFTGEVRVIYHHAREMELDEYERWKEANPQKGWPKIGVRWAGDDHMEHTHIRRPSDLGQRYFSVLDLLGIKSEPAKQ